MIEVEKQFSPKDDQLQSLLKDARFVSEHVNHDVAYDYPDYRLFKKHVRLRNRNGSFELKVGKTGGVSEEMESRKDIENYFNTPNLDEFIKNNLAVILEYTCKRKKYKKGDFTIDLDEMDFGYKLCEIELMVEKEEQVKDAEEKIINLAKKYNFELKRVPSKRAEYFRRFKPEVYKDIFGNSERFFN